MSAKAISEASAKGIIYKALTCESVSKNPFRVVAHEDVQGVFDIGLLNGLPLVSKPDVLVKRRGKHGLVAINKTRDQIKEWLSERLGKSMCINGVNGSLDRFLIEPFIPHEQSEEYYLCIYTQRECNVILFHHEGGIAVGDVDQKAQRFEVPVTDLFAVEQETQGQGCLRIADRILGSTLLSGIPDEARRRLLADFIQDLHRVFDQLHFTYLEVNPLVVCDWSLPGGPPPITSGLRIHLLDAAAKLDQCAEFLFNGSRSGFQHARGWLVGVDEKSIEFPTPFGLTQTAEEAFVASLDARTGASMKLSVLNPNGRIWTMCAGGGASVIYADTVCSLAERLRTQKGQGHGARELANYGEYSGAPTEGQTYDYARTILTLMTSGEPNPDGKVLLIGGGIANFTNVAATFKGIICALKEFQASLQAHRVRIFVRRAGPNYQEGLRLMRELGHTLGVPMFVFGPETHMTAIVSMALGLTDIPLTAAMSGDSSVQHYSSSSSENLFGLTSSGVPDCPQEGEAPATQGINSTSASGIFTRHTRCIIWGLQVKAVQSMLDFDYLCYREKPSVAALVYPFGEGRQIKVYYGSKEIFIPVFKSIRLAVEAHPDARLLINFSSLRVAYEVTIEAMDLNPPGEDPTNGSCFQCVAIIAEGIPENWTRRLIVRARARNVLLIGPATVGGIKPGCFKIGNTGGMIDNILASRLYRPGSVAYVSRSGGMSNELNNIISLNTDGVEEGVAIGGDRYPGSNFVDHILRFEDNPNVSMIVLLGEVGGREEYRVAELVRSARVEKPIVAWCIGTCAQLISQSLDGSSVQFGHAGACANSVEETAEAKNRALAQAGLHVPESFDEMGNTIRAVFNNLVASGKVTPKATGRPRPVPIDYAWARELGLVRRPTAFTSTICDDRGAELLFAGVPISQVINEGLGIGGVLGLLWFKRRLPDYAKRFFELCLVITADHGPAVSGALNTIVTARAGKDLLSSLTAGLLTIGDRFGGALDGAARQFSTAFDAHLSPAEFVANERRASRLIMGIGHRVKSITNPDMRVKLLAEFVHKHFLATPLVDYAFEVEKVTTAKRPNLILNVDGMIGVATVDLLRHCGHFTREEADEYISIGTLNAIFVLGRSIGFIGHYLDQRRLHQELYRHPWEDISYMLPDGMDV